MSFTTLQAAVPETVVTDSNVSTISGFEFYRNGMYWWKNGFVAGEFSERGVMAYGGYTGATRFNGAAELQRRGGVQLGGALKASISLPVRNSKYHYFEKDHFSLGNDMVRNEGYAFYVRNGILRTKALHQGVSDSGLSVKTQVVAGGFLYGLDISANGVLFYDSGTLFYWKLNGSTIEIYGVTNPGASLGGTVFYVASVAGSNVKKVMLTAIDGRPGQDILLLTLTGNLYRIPLVSFATPVLISGGIGDFAVRREQWASANPFLLYEWRTIIYAGTYTLTGGSAGRLLLIQGNSLTSTVSYNTNSVAVQIGSVACDEERLVISESTLSGPDPVFGGYSDNGTGRLRRRISLYTTWQFGSTSPWETSPIALESGLNLRSNGQHFYYLRGNQIRRLSTDAPQLRLDHRAIGLEVVQVVQDMNNSIPLIAGKNTVVRAYAEVAANTTGYLGPDFSPPGRLIVEHNGVAIGQLSAINNPKISAPEALANIRTDLGKSYLFDVPVDLIRPGTMRFVFTVNPAHSDPETDVNWISNNSAVATLNCEAKQRPALLMVPIATQVGIYNPNDNAAGYADILNRGASMLPINGFRVWRRANPVYKPVLRARLGIPPWEIVNRSFRIEGQQSLGLIWLSVAHALDRLPPEISGDRHYVGMIPKATPDFNGVGGIANRNVSEVLPGLPGILEPIVGSYKIPPNAWSNSLLIRMEDGKEVASAPDWYSPRGGIALAHELGHNYGRFHINFGSGESPEGPFDTLPFHEAFFGPTNYSDPANILGFDWLTCSVVRTDQAGDLMSYAETRWPSRETYLAIMNVIPDGPAPPSPNSPRGGAPSLLLVQGTIEPGFRAANMDPAYCLPQSELDAATVDTFATIAEGLGSQFPISLRQLGPNNTVLREDPVLPGHLHAEGDADLTQFLAFVPPAAGTVRLELIADGSIICQRLVSKNAPVVGFGDILIDPDTIKLNWNASDLDDDILLFTVQQSRDAGVSWESLAGNLGESSIDLDAKLTPGGEVVFRVIATDGYHSHIAQSSPVLLPDLAPSCSFTGIVEGDRLAYGEMRTISGNAYDPEDGPLDGLTWSVEGNGISRSYPGASFLLGDLPPGVFTLSLVSPLDSGGIGSTRQITFRVLPISIPEGDTAPVLDGICGDSAYAYSPVLRIDHGDGTHATVRMVHQGGSLYLCFTGLRFGTNGSPGATAGILFDRDASGEATAQLGDIGFFVDENGVVWQTQGDGSVMQISNTPQAGADVVVVRNELSWNAEMCLPDALLGGWDHAAGFVVCHDKVNGSESYGAWPPAANPNQPETWSTGDLGPSDPLPNLPPVAQAGADFVVNASSGDSVVLNGDGSFDPDGDSLVYAWRQISGPSVDLVNSTSSTPSFAAPVNQASATLVFGLIVNDGEVASMEDGVSVILRFGDSTPVQPPPTFMPMADSSGDNVQLSLQSPPVGGNCFMIQTSENLKTWDDLALGAPDLFGRVSWPDRRPPPASGRRFYRLAPCPEPNRSILFSDNNGAINVPHSPSLNSYPMTISFWLKTTTSDANIRGVFNKYFDSSFLGYSVFLKDGRLNCWYFRDANNYVYIPPSNSGVVSQPIADGNWHHVAIVIGPAGGRFFVDGLAAGNLPWFGTPSATTTNAQFQIGKYNSYPTSFLGELDEISFWNLAMDATALQNLAQNPPNGNEPGLVGLWTCDSEGGAILYDSSSNAHNGTAVGGVRFLNSTAPTSR